MSQNFIFLGFGLAWLGLALVCIFLRVKNHLGCILHWVHLDLFHFQRREALEKHVIHSIESRGKEVFKCTAFYDENLNILQHVCLHPPSSSLLTFIHRIKANECHPLRHWQEIGSVQDQSELQSAPVIGFISLNLGPGSHCSPPPVVTLGQQPALLS